MVLKSKKKIAVIGLGGTIASQARRDTYDYGSPSTDVNGLVGALKFNEIDVTVKPVLNKISQEITLSDILFLAGELTAILSDDYDGAVVAMGTNTLEDVAYQVGLILKTKKPVVFTGSNYPQGGLCFDGQLNLFNAIHLAASEESIEEGILVTFNGYVFQSRYLCKVFPGTIEAYSAILTPSIGTVDNKGFKKLASSIYRHTFRSEFEFYSSNDHSQVAILYAHLGMNHKIINCLLDSGVKGIVAAGFGEGYQPEEVADTLSEAISSEIVVVRCPRQACNVTNGNPSYDRKYGFIYSSILSPSKASILLSLSIMNQKNKKDIARIFEEY
jgi:L-asparaginase